MNFVNQLNEKFYIILASSSPRRKQLLKSIGFLFTSIVPEVNEKDFIFDTIPQNYCQFLSIIKAINVYHNVSKLEKSIVVNDTTKIIKPIMIIAADTIVVLDNEIINKPKDSDDAINILKKLNNNKHKVFTGLCILSTANQEEKLISRYSETDVYFRKLLEDEIIDYVNTGSPLDKAGGYGIQDFGCLFVRRIDGCYNNVVGLPLELLNQMLSLIKN